ncbi:MAG: WbqC family protein [Deltaproteobacteria bacterium]|nr:WbqC family protein [Candidatus Zymogenaceae bacterium]
MIVAIHQPQYLPWLGYFHKMHQADAFVFLDTVQFKKNEYQNRNRIKGPQGPQWLTVPVLQRLGQDIRDVRINTTVNWQKKHIAALGSCYGRAPHYGAYRDALQDLLDRPWELLSPLNIEVTKLIASSLGIDTQLYLASEMDGVSDDRDRRLIEITQRLGGDMYLAGVGGRDYMNLATWEKAGIDVLFQQFEHPVYPQIFDGFTSHLSAVDLLFNTGGEAMGYLDGSL